MSNGKTQHQKLDTLLKITTDIRIKQGVFEERLDNAKEDIKEMKDDIKENAKHKRLSNFWDSINSLAIGIGTYFGIKH